jgi:2-polyprenyl-6-methoxyphenol hydroxylase-like FAD-dependent oxidoreductase
MPVRSVLVVGAGIAGSTLAVLLGRGGVSTTLVERAGDQRSTGGPVVNRPGMSGDLLV